MTIRVKALIAASALMTLSATCAYAGASDDFGGSDTGSWNSSSGQQYGTWNDGSNAIGSQIANKQVTTQTSWSNLSTSVDTIGGDAAIQGVAAGNLIDITTMNNTAVKNSQIVGPGAAIGSNIDADVTNVWGSVGVSNQVVCNGASVSTDPTYAATRSYQECSASDPASRITTNISNIAGNAAIQSASLGNSFEADSNAANMPVWNQQINRSTVASTVNSNVFNVAGSTSITSSAIGNTGQIIHYSTN